MRNAMTVLLIIIAVCTHSISGEDWRRQLGTKTPYFPHSGAPPLSPPATCTTKFFQIVSRHGTRNPTGGTFKSLVKLEDTIKNYVSVLNVSHSWMGQWEVPYKETRTGFLVVNGEKELYHLGKRLKGRYEEIFEGDYSPELFPVQTTYVPRAARSGNAFAYATFGENQGVLGEHNYQPFYTFSNTKMQDKTLRFFKMCPAYVNFKDDYTKQKNLFKEAEFPAIAKSLSEILTTDQSWKIEIEDVVTLWSACAHEYSILNIENQFCTLFTPEQFDTIEIFYDLESYYEKGYGWDLSYEIACPLVNEIVQFMDDVVNNGDETQAYLRFAHAETLLPTLARMGLYKDKFELKYDTPREKLNERQWRTSYISSFATNLVFTLYDCGIDGYKVETLHDEEQMELPGCDGIFCDYEIFKKIYLTDLPCDFNQMCGIVECEPQTDFVFVILLVLGILLIIVLVVTTIILVSEKSSNKFQKI